MKAFKITSIQWNLNHITDENEKKEILSNLPTEKGFTTSDDNFNYRQRVPVLLKKKFGYDIDSFKCQSYRVVTNVIDLLNLVTPNGTNKVKSLFDKTGKLSTYGQMCLDGVIANLYYAKRLHDINTPEDKIPVVVDECMLGVENIFNLEFDTTPVDVFEERLTNIIKEIVVEKTKKYKMFKEDIKNRIEEEAEAEA